MNKATWTLCFILLLGALFGCGEAAHEDPVADRFLGPLPGTVHEYLNADGVRMEVAGIAWVEKGRAVRVRETTLLPSELLPPELADRVAPGESGVTSVREYVLRAEGERLVLEEAGERTILADLSGDAWSIPAMTTSAADDAAAGPAESDWVVREAECRMSECGERVLFGASRKVFTVACFLAADRNGSEPMQVVDLELAEGIGVIRLGDLELTAVQAPGKPQEGDPNKP